MQDKELSQLLRNESFLNYCFNRNAGDVRYWEEWLAAHPGERQSVEELKTLAVLLANETQLSESEQQYALLKQRIAAGSEEKTGARAVSLYTKLAIAASLVLICAAGLLFYTRYNRTSETAGPRTLVNDVAPGGNKAILTLASGRKVSLTDASEGIIAKEAGAVITKTSDGKLTYVSPDVQNAEPAAGFNTVETPRGGQYQVRLPDGTNVWLNAASSLKYPASFAGAPERRVELSGEAYFEVAADKDQPFIVKSARQEVRVLGTSFDVSAYSDEPYSSTTLASGSVSIKEMISGSRKLLKPGEQSVIEEGGNRIVVGQVNPGDFIAWKSGYFIFDNKDIGSIMKVISRWYDVDVVYRSYDRDERFGGTFSKSSNLSEILGNLEKLGKIDFKISGRRIIVSDLQ